MTDNKAVDSRAEFEEHALIQFESEIPFYARTQDFRKAILDKYPNVDYKSNWTKIAWTAWQAALASSAATDTGISRELLVESYMLAEMPESEIPDDPKAALYKLIDWHHDFRKALDGVATDTGMVMDAEPAMYQARIIKEDDSFGPWVEVSAEDYLVLSSRSLWQTRKLYAALSPQPASSGESE